MTDEIVKDGTVREWLKRIAKTQNKLQNKHV
jgi:hypothetical protein